MSEERLHQIIAEYLEAEASGETPDREQFFAENPDLADELRAFFADHDRIRELAEPLRPPDDAPTPPTPGDDLSDAPTIPPTEPAAEPAQQDGSFTIGTHIRYFGDYELLEEIARGGMGVVYKARQVKLNRIVAVKMILAGQLASEDDVRRFYTEAESAANLKHPGIVAIHEVGEHEGQHYFSMDYIEGKSLADLVRENPLAAKRAAGYVKSMAEAIHYAHEQGTVHRDLKPANVLIDQSGQPNVTDFGLVKKVEGDSSLTATGQILGTPSYMPPEQAGGKTDQVGPLSDVYALGAILYELLTGRPPFRAETPLDTLVQVIESPPARPRMLNPKIPRDLETICLKCLAKEPQQRYRSAQKLADDLGRFLRGERVLALRRKLIFESVGPWAWSGAAAGGAIATLFAVVGALAGEPVTTRYSLVVVAAAFGVVGAIAGLVARQLWNILIGPLWLLTRTTIPLAKAAAGLGLMLTSLLLTVAIEGPRSFGYLRILPEALLMPATVLGAFGPVLCLAVAAQSKSHGILYTAIGLHIAALVMRISEPFQFGPLVVRDSGTVPGLQGFSVDWCEMGTKGIAFLLLVVFFLRLARFLNEAEMEFKARLLLRLGIGFAVLICAMPLSVMVASVTGSLSASWENGRLSGEFTGPVGPYVMWFVLVVSLLLVPLTVLLVVKYYSLVCRLQLAILRRL